MEAMRVYRISTIDLGNCILLEPSIPKHPMKNEDIITPRICCAPTIMGCIDSAEIINTNIDRLEAGECITLYLYEAYVDVSNIHQPVNFQLPDQWLTGELWLFKSQEFYKINKYVLRKHMDLPNSAYSRFSMTSINNEEVLDVISASKIYGNLDSFSFIDFNELRSDMAISYHEKQQMSQIIQQNTDLNNQVIHSKSVYNENNSKEAVISKLIAEGILK